MSVPVTWPHCLSRGGRPYQPLQAWQADPCGQPAGNKAIRDPSQPGYLAADDASDTQLVSPNTHTILALYRSAAPRPAAAGDSPRSARSTVEARLPEPASESDRRSST